MYVNGLMARAGTYAFERSPQQLKRRVLICILMDRVEAVVARFRRVKTMYIKVIYVADALITVRRENDPFQHV